MRRGRRRRRPVRSTAAGASTITHGDDDRVVSSPNPSQPGETVTFTATVTDGSGGPVTAGTVTFSDGATGPRRRRAARRRRPGVVHPAAFTPGTHHGHRQLQRSPRAPRRAAARSGNWSPTRRRVCSAAPTRVAVPDRGAGRSVPVDDHHQRRVPRRPLGHRPARRPHPHRPDDLDILLVGPTGCQRRGDERHRRHRRRDRRRPHLRRRRPGPRSPIWARWHRAATGPPTTQPATPGRRRRRRHRSSSPPCPRFSGTRPQRGVEPLRRRRHHADAGSIRWLVPRRSRSDGDRGRVVGEPVAARRAGDVHGDGDRATAIR